MRLVFSVCVFLLMAFRGVAGEDLSAAQISRVEQWAKVHQVPTEQAVAQYSTLLGDNYQKALGAYDYFRKKKAFAIAARALVEARNGNIQAAALDILEEKPDFSRPAFDAVMSALEKYNQIDQFLATDDGEHSAGIEMMKSRLARLAAKWVGIADPKIFLSGSYDTRSPYKEFIARARQKAATLSKNDNDPDAL